MLRWALKKSHIFFIFYFIDLVQYYKQNFNIHILSKQQQDNVNLCSSMMKYQKKEAGILSDRFSRSFFLFFVVVVILFLKKI